MLTREKENIFNSIYSSTFYIYEVAYETFISPERKIRISEVIKFSENGFPILSIFHLRSFACCLGSHIR